MKRLIALFLILVVLTGFTSPPSPLSTSVEGEQMLQSGSDFTVQLHLVDNVLWTWTCIDGCDFWQTLGTEAELERIFATQCDAINWVYFLLDRRFGTQHAPCPLPT